MKVTFGFIKTLQNELWFIKMHNCQEDFQLKSETRSFRQSFFRKPKFSRRAQSKYTKTMWESIFFSQSCGKLPCLVFKSILEGVHTFRTSKETLFLVYVNNLKVLSHFTISSLNQHLLCYNLKIGLIILRFPPFHNSFWVLGTGSSMELLRSYVLYKFLLNTNLTCKKWGKCNLETVFFHKMCSLNVPRFILGMYSIKFCMIYGFISLEGKVLDESGFWKQFHIVLFQDTGCSGKRCTWNFVCSRESYQMSSSSHLSQHFRFILF